tara:strand:- start:377 stop:1333 length:957 start_codon:yes stop_codon:yes gene_type:complete
MANNKLHGYNPDPSKEAKVGVVHTQNGNRLDRFNPYEFRKGMDYELTTMGCSRLAESSDDERRKATETVLNNLEEHGGYYTSLITYETHFRNLAEGSKKPSFKAWLAEQEEFQMKEVGKKGAEFKNDKMTELKEAITREIKTMLAEVKNKEVDAINKADAEADKEPSKKDMKGSNKGPAVQARAAIDAAKKDLDKAEADRAKRFDKYKVAKSKAKTDDAAADAKSSYVADIKTLQDTINKKKAEIKKLTDSLTDISEERKILRREVAKTMMDKDTHMEILKIVKEAGVDLREGSGAIRMHYEIAKTAYQEGFMKALDK